MTEKLCLQWNDFQENIRTAFRDLREDKNFTDVTLACEDGRKVEAHKVILVASSPFFQRLLDAKNKQALVYMRGTKFDNLSAIVDFLYHGEANVFQENLDSFLALAQELQLKGLTGTDEGTSDNATTWNENTKYHKFIGNDLEDFRIKTQNKDTTKILETSSTSFSGNANGLDERVYSLMEKSQNNVASGRHRANICKVCGKEGDITAIKDHIEAKHLEGVILACNYCDKTFRTRHARRDHNTKHHSKATFRSGY